MRKAVCNYLYCTKCSDNYLALMESGVWNGGMKGGNNYLKASIICLPAAAANHLVQRNLTKRDRS